MTRTATSTQFWRDRDYVKDASKVKASVFTTHGFQDDNVRMDHVGMWWDAPEGQQRRAQAVAAARRPRGSVRVAPRASGSTRCTAGSTTTSTASTTASTNEPAVTIEDEKDVWGDYADWPIPGTQNVDVFLRSTGAATAGTLGGQPGVGATDTLGFTRRPPRARPR